MVELKPSIWVNMTLLYQHYPNIIPSKIQSFIITFPGITWSFLAVPIPAIPVKQTALIHSSWGVSRLGRKAKHQAI